MHIPIVLVFVLLQCTLCLSIRVPVDWSDDSEVNKSEKLVHTVENEEADVKPPSSEYFLYPAKKPQFAIDLAAANGVQSPENSYKSHPVRPYTGLPKQQLGQHHIQDPQKIINRPNQGHVHSSGGLNYARPSTTSFEVFHPYKSEEPALQQLYNDPVLDKIRNNLRDSDHKLQKYENQAGGSDITKNEHLESPDQIDRKKVPQKNIPTQYEVHKPERRPVYYRYPPKHQHRDYLINNKLRHPWNQNIVKVTPIHYRPIKNHLHNLRQHHAIKYDDERNEYPQLTTQNDDDDKSEGFDIYEKGEERFVNLRNNVDDTINQIVEKNKHEKKIASPSQEDHNDSTSEEEDEEDFVPIKNYAQVRKTETTKHLPREAALQDAENIEEIENAPRLREAIKSKKAQIVYSEEGYEDSAYDHAGEQKQASDHESHGGYLKEKETSKGKFKTPTFATKYGDTNGSRQRDQILHGEEWENDIKENLDETDSDYYESQEENTDISDITENDNNDKNDRNRRNTQDKKDNITNINSTIDKKLYNVHNKTQSLLHHGVIKREISTKNNSNLKLQSSTKLSDNNTLNMKSRQKATNDDDIKKKYPYYFQNLNVLSKNSPIRYAENFDFIPKKSSGGTEFYDSRSNLECPEVEDDVDPIPEKLKKEGHPGDNENSEGDSDEKSKEEAKFESIKNTQRLKGLGDKIDCFKAKYFGENPLDSPFFKEDIIENPEPVTVSLPELFQTKQQEKLKSPIESHNSNLFIVLDKFRNNQISHDTNRSFHKRAESSSNVTASVAKEQSNDKLDHIRIKRANPFAYEPYKIIRDSQTPDSKKTTTSSNISPLIKQLQLSRVIDKVTIQDKDQIGKKNNTKVYKDIGKSDRLENRNDQNDSSILSFVDVNVDQRRGEPRYEIRPINHKPQYSPVEHKRVVSAVDFKAQTGKDIIEKKTTNVESTTQPQLKRSKRRKPTARPYFDVSQYLPQSTDKQQISASNTVRKIIRTTTPESRTVTEPINIDEKEYDEFKEKDKGQDKITTTTTRTTQSTIRKRTRGTTTTSRPGEIEDKSESPKLRLITRFRDHMPNIKSSIRYDATENPLDNSYVNEHNSPKYTEKKRKSTKSTLVTDTKSYGEGHEDDNKKEEVDELIGIKHDMEEYTPLYEREINEKNRLKNKDLKSRKNIYGGIYNIYDDDDDEDDDNIHSIHTNDDDDDEDDDDDDEDEDEDEFEEEDTEEDDTKRESDDIESRLEATTSEPTKRTLVKTTEAPATTTESRSARIEMKPIISKKKIEIHKETPFNKSSPHITQFKQDIKEIEIIKESAPKLKKRPNKHTEALDLFRDEKLAEEVNKLGDVEVFRENLDLNSGPKHGGNYRSITPKELQEEMTSLSQSRDNKNKGDVEASQSETRKSIELDEKNPSRRRGSINSHRSPQRNGRERSAKFVELQDTYESKPPSMHGGNLKLSKNQDQRGRKSEKYVEIDEEDEEEPSSMHGGNFKSYGNTRNTGRMHGGNYRSAKLTKSNDDNKDEQKSTNRNQSKDARTHAATALNGFARAIPMLTTTPVYILDPSKRMYYYVDA